MIPLGSKVRYLAYDDVYGIVVDRYAKDPPRYDIRCTNGIYMRAVKEEDLEAVGDGADAVDGDDGGRVSKSA